jgi:hypothetical protein
MVAFSPSDIQGESLPLLSLKSKSTVMDITRGVTVKEFTESAADFCQMMEQCAKLKTGELFFSLQKMLPLLYLRALQLPTPKYCYEEEPKRFVKEDDYAMIHDSVQQKIDLYLGITQMSPGTKPNRVGVQSFTTADGFANIYEELKNYLMLYEAGIPQAMNDAVWICRKSFEQGLGVRMIDSLKSIHQLIYSKSTDGSRALLGDDFESLTEEEPWYSDDQEEVYGDDE